MGKQNGGVNIMEIEYKKLLDLEKLKSEALDKLLDFQRNNQNYLENLTVQYFRIQGEFLSAFKKWEKFKDHLEKKYNFEFPVECYCSGTDNYLFAEFFKTKQ